MMATAISSFARATNGAPRSRNPCARPISSVHTREWANLDGRQYAGKRASHPPSRQAPPPGPAGEIRGFKLSKNFTAFHQSRVLFATTLTNGGGRTRRSS